MSFDGRPVYAEIDLSSLEKNIRAIKSVTGTKKIIAVVKDNAYGHGALKVVARLDAYCDIFGVASFKEAFELRKITKKPFIVFGGFFKGDEKYFSENIVPTVYEWEMLEKLEERAIPTNVNIEFDTGMGRTGFQVEEADRLIKRLRLLKNVKVYGLMTHFAASESNVSFTEKQLELFYRVYGKFIENDFLPQVVHVANSGGIFYSTKEFINAVRPGIMIYGSYPSDRLRSKISLIPVMTFKSQIIALKKVKKDTPISYGGTFITKRESLIATIACGYGDGYMRALSNKGVVYIEDKGIAPVVGNVCMDMIMADVTDVKGASKGDTVILWGNGESAIHPDNIAKLANTISYELFCRVSNRIKRVYKG